MNWPTVPLGEVLRLAVDPVDVTVDGSYPGVGVYGFGRGLFAKPPVAGDEISATRLFRVRGGQFMYSRLKAFEGAFATVPDELSGRFVTNEFPTFDSEPGRLSTAFLAYYFRTPDSWAAAARCSTGIGARRDRLHPEQFLRMPIPLPPLAEQRRIVGRVDAIAGRLADARRLRAEAEVDIDRMLFGAYSQITAAALCRPLQEVAPLVRRPAVVDTANEYPGVSVRSFGRGTFHNPPQAGSAITWEKPHEVHAGDILVSNIKAWEGALAVAGPADHGRYGSHRYLTFVPVAGVATARFVCFHLLTPDGLFHVGEASPGSADRNRTLSAKTMLAIPVPVPAYDKQLWFDALCEKADALRSLQAATATDLDGLLPAVLAEAFAGRL